MIDLVHSLLNIPELYEPSEKSSSRTDRFGKPKHLWQVWPTDAIEHGAPQWIIASVKGAWQLPVSEEIEDSLTTYLARPWLAHPLLDWALMSGWLLGAAHRWHRKIEDGYLGRDFKFWIAASSRRKLGATANATMDLIDASDGAAQLRQIKYRSNWKHGVFCICLAAIAVFFKPEHWLSICGILICWFAFNYWFELRSFRKVVADLAADIERDSAAMQKVKAAWLATNATAMDLDDVAGKVWAAEQAGLPISPGYRALLSAIRERHGRVLAVDWS